MSKEKLTTHTGTIQEKKDTVEVNEEKKRDKIVVTGGDKNG